MLLQAISNEWYYQMYYDLLPMWAFIGHVDPDPTSAAADAPGRQLLFLHVHFEVHYNGNNVIEVAVTPDESHTLDISEAAVGVEAEVAAEFSYSVSWHETPVEYTNRLDHYHQVSHNPVHLEVCGSCAADGGCVHVPLCGCMTPVPLMVAVCTCCLGAFVCLGVGVCDGSPVLWPLYRVMHARRGVQGSCGVAAVSLGCHSASAMKVAETHGGCGRCWCDWADRGRSGGGRVSAAVQWRPHRAGTDAPASAHARVYVLRFTSISRSSWAEIRR